MSGVVAQYRRWSISGPIITILVGLMILSFGQCRLYAAENAARPNKAGKSTVNRDGEKHAKTHASTRKEGQSKPTPAKQIFFPKPPTYEVNGITYKVIDRYNKWFLLLFNDKSFSAVEGHIAELLKQQHNEKYAYELYELYKYLANLWNMTNEQLKSVESTLNEWCAASPNSHIPWLVRGNFLGSYGWLIRGSDYASNVSNEAMFKFHEYLKRAKIDLEKSRKINSEDPNSSASLIIVAKGLKYSYAQMEYYFSCALKACPGHYGAYWNKFDYIKPRWYGSWSELYEFANESLELSKEYPFLGDIMLEYYREISDVGLEDTSFLSNTEVWNRINKIFVNYFSKYPDDLQWHFYYALFAYNAKKYDIAIKQFELIGNTWLVQTSWYYLKTYNNARARTNYECAARVNPEKSLSYLKKAVELDPYMARYPYELGSLQMELRMYDEAEKSLLKAINIDSCFVPAQLRLSYLYGAVKGDQKLARDYAANVLRCDTCEIQNYLAREYMAGNFSTVYKVPRVVKKEPRWQKYYDYWRYFITMRLFQ